MELLTLLEKDPKKYLQILDKYEFDDNMRLVDYVKACWHIVDPGVPYKHGPHIDCICEHLEAVSNGEINRLLINIPPGCSKSSLVSVYFPSWEWGPRRLPYLKHLCCSHSQKLSIRDNTKARRIIESDFYQKKWGSTFNLCSDQNAKTKFENNYMGFKEAVGVGGGVTGLRADRIIIDDAIDARDSNSEVIRANCLTWFYETAQTRTVDPVKSAIIVIMQRLHEADIAGEIIAKELGYEQVILPMRFEPDRVCKTHVHPGGVRKEELYTWDKRTKENELLFPSRFPEKTVAELESTMGEYAVAGQFQQRPAPRSGGIFKRDKLKIVNSLPCAPEFVIRGWDLAGSIRKQAAYTAGVKIAYCKEQFYIMDVIRFRGEEDQVVKTMVDAANKDGVGCIIDFPQDPGQAGKSQAKYITGRLMGFQVKSSLESGDKLQRAMAMIDQANAGNVNVVKGEWNEKFLHEAAMFPNGTYKDQIDAASRAFHRLLEMVKNSKMNQKVCGALMI